MDNFLDRLTLESSIKSWILVDQSDIWIPKCTKGGITDLGDFPKFYQFLVLPLAKQSQSL